MAEPAAAAGTAVEKINVKNVTGTLFNYSNATAYQCGAQFTENEFHVVNNSAVPRSLVRHNAFDAQTDLVLLLRGIHSVLHLHWSGHSKYHSRRYSTRPTTSQSRGQK